MFPKFKLLFIGFACGYQPNSKGKQKILQRLEMFRNLSRVFGCEGDDDGGVKEFEVMSRVEKGEASFLGPESIFVRRPSRRLISEEGWARNRRPDLIS